MGRGREVEERWARRRGEIRCEHYRQYACSTVTQSGRLSPTAPPQSPPAAFTAVADGCHEAPASGEWTHNWQRWYREMASNWTFLGMPYNCLCLT